MVVVHMLSSLFRVSFCRLPGYIYCSHARMASVHVCSRVFWAIVWMLYAMSMLSQTLFTKTVLSEKAKHVVILLFYAIIRNKNKTHATQNERRHGYSKTIWYERRFLYAHAIMSDAAILGDDARRPWMVIYAASRYATRADEPRWHYIRRSSSPCQTPNAMR